MGRSRTRESVNNMLMGYLNQVVMFVLTFISRTLFIRIFGMEFLGINGLFSDVLSLLSMADLGMNTAMVYSFYKPIAENDTKKICALTNFYKKVYRIIAISITTIGLAITPFLNFIVNTEKEVPHLYIYYLFALAGVVVSYLFVYKTSIITANQRNYIVIRINMIVTLLKTIVQIISIVVFKNYIVYLFVNLVGNFIKNYVSSRKAEKLYPYINDKETLGKEEKKGIFENIKSVFIYKISSVLLNCTDNTLISVLIGTIAVGIYSNYFLVSNKITFIIQLTFGAVTASVGNLIVKENSKKRYEIFKATQSISCILSGIVAICYACLINDLISVWIGKDSIFNNSVVLAISFNMYLICILQPLYTYREAAGIFKKTKYVMAITAIINLILSIILGKLMGIAGILLASAIARLTTYFWYEPLILFRDYFQESVSKYFINILKNFIIMVISYAGIKFLISYFVVTSWATLFIKAGICGVITGLLFLIIYFKSDGVEIILKKLNLRKSKKIGISENKTSS